MFLVEKIPVHFCFQVFFFFIYVLRTQVGIQVEIQVDTRREIRGHLGGEIHGIFFWPNLDFHRFTQISTDFHPGFPAGK